MGAGAGLRLRFLFAVSSRARLLSWLWFLIQKNVRINTTVLWGLEQKKGTTNGNKLKSEKLPNPTGNPRNPSHGCFWKVHSVFLGALLYQPLSFVDAQTFGKRSIKSLHLLWRFHDQQEAAGMKRLRVAGKEESVTALPTGLHDWTEKCDRFCNLQPKLAPKWATSTVRLENKTRLRKKGQ